MSLRFLKKMRKKLYAIKQERKIKFVHGIGKKKSKLQRAVEELEAYIERTKKYIMEKYICGERNSYSKTDHDATFMRLKEDAMPNGQLKPAYNVQHGVDSEYIVWPDVSAHPTDTLTLIPFLRKAEEMMGYKYKNIVADAGYESEENYVFIELNDKMPISNRQTMKYPRQKNTGPTLENSKIWHTIHPGIHISAGMGKN